MLWRLPDFVSDVLPREAAQLENARAACLALFKSWGYEQIAPPLLEEAAALTTGTGAALDAVMFRTTDPASGRALGLRADITPQAARIDAHILHRSGVNRLSYCGQVLRTHVNGAFEQREQWQLGAELFGYAGLEADIEIQDLALATLAQLQLEGCVLSLAHSGVLSAAFAANPALSAQQDEIVQALRAKDLTALQNACAASTAPLAYELLALMAQSWRNADNLNIIAAKLPAAKPALDALATLAARAKAQGAAVMIDLADLHGFTYHTGAQLAVYHASSSAALLRGGRYDAIGAAYGKPRAATGFSLDLRNALRGSPLASAPQAIAAPWAGDAALDAQIAQLRAQGHIVIRLLPGQSESQDGFHITQHLVPTPQGAWALQTL